MKRNTSKFSLCENDQSIIERLTCASDTIRKNQTIKSNLLPWIFVAPDTSKDQDQFNDTVFLNTKWSHVLLMYPDLN